MLGFLTLGAADRACTAAGGGATTAAVLVIKDSITSGNTGFRIQGSGSRVQGLVVGIRPAAMVSVT